MKQRSRFVLISLTSAAMFGVLTTGAARAEVECKGLEQVQCGDMAGCSWTNAYTRKDGKSVAGYCKRVAARGDAAATGPVPQKMPAVKETAPKPVVKGTPPATMPSGAAMGAGAPKTPAAAATAMPTGNLPAGTGTVKTPYGQGTGTGTTPMPK
ncbi:MAG TPA: hypothetical protein VES73_00175 [Lamprocystis sp. (in: g-proteobacteria)]|nr:hypothetical protein [Lamprocystis sp. (in: g-proteobacteria)]